MTYADWILDGTLAATMLVLAWRVTEAPELAKAVVLYIAFGLLSALAWIRLDAVDVALVEASVGTGLTGALFMTALSWAAPGSAAVTARGRPWLTVVAIALATALGSIVLRLPASAGLTEEVSTQLAHAGVSQPVTAVLMNYRGYDTLLETVVLLVAAMAVRVVQPGGRRSAGKEPSDLLRAFVDLLVPASVLLAGYLVWSGSFAPGGAFQGGAVLAGGGVALMLANRLGGPRMSSFTVRTCLLVGPALFLVLAAGSLLVSGGLLEYPTDSAGALIFALESTLAISIALVLLTFFPGAPSSAMAARPPARGEG